MSFSSVMFTTRNSHLITRSPRCSEFSAAWPTTSELQSMSWLVFTRLRRGFRMRLCMHRYVSCYRFATRRPTWKKKIQTNKKPPNILYKTKTKSIATLSARDGNSGCLCNRVLVGISGIKISYLFSLIVSVIIYR